jgi:hypothetical protein
MVPLLVCVIGFITAIITEAIRQSSTYHSIVTKLYRCLNDYKTRGVRVDPQLVEKYLDYYLWFRQDEEEEDHD